MLKELTLISLGETKAGEQFEEAMEVVRQSLSRDNDVQGARTITIKMQFKPDDRGCVFADITVAANTPRRKVKSLAMIENGQLKIDTFTNDAKQPIRAMLDKYLPEAARKRDYRVASLTWCVYGKKWLINVERKEAQNGQV